MDLKQIISKIKSVPNTNEDDIQVATLLFNLGLTFKGAGKIVKNNKGEKIGELDLIFKDENEDVLFIIEVSRQDKKATQKVGHFFSKWSNKSNLDFLKRQHHLIAKDIYKLNFDLKQRKVPVSEKASLKHILNKRNIIINKLDFDYFLSSYNKISKWAKNDLYNFLGFKSDAGFTKVPAIVFHTGTQRIFVYADKVENILRYAYIYRRRENEMGYQRMIEQKRIGSILKTIKRKKTITFPNSIILNSDSKLTKQAFHPDDTPKAVTIDVPKGYCKCRIIDGQHRLMGFAKMGALLRNDFSLPIVILEKLNQAKEIETFIEINHKQKRLDSNLILSLKADFPWKETDEEYFEKISVLVARELSESSELKEKIFFGYADEKKGDKITVTTLDSAFRKNNFIGSNSPLFQKKPSDVQEPYNHVKDLFATVGAIFKNEKRIFYTNLGIRILFRYVRIYLKNYSEAKTTKNLTESFEMLRKMLPGNQLNQTIKDNYGEGGAKAAVDVLIEHLKKDSDYQNLESDLRAFSGK